MVLCSLIDIVTLSYCVGKEELENTVAKTADIHESAVKGSVLLAIASCCSLQFIAVSMVEIGAKLSMYVRTVTYDAACFWFSQIAEGTLHRSTEPTHAMTVPAPTPNASNVQIASRA